MQFGGEPCAAAKALGEPRRQRGILSGRPEHEGSGAVKRLEVRAAQGIMTFLAAPPAGGDQARDRAVRAPVSGEQHQPGLLEAHSVPRISGRPHSFAAWCARTAPASEHSSVSASAR